MSRRATRSTDQYSPFEHLRAGPTRPSLADSSTRDAILGAVVASVAFPAAVLAASFPAVAVGVVAAILALLAGRATLRREDAHYEREAARAQRTESSSSATVQAAD